MKEILKNNKKLVVIVTTVFILLVLLILYCLGVFTNKRETKGQLKIVYRNGQELKIKKDDDKFIATKKITIKNKGENGIIYALSEEKIINDIGVHKFKFNLTCESSDGDCSYINIKDSNLPSSKGNIATNIFIEPKEKQTIIITIEITDDSEISEEQIKKFEMILDVNESIEDSKYGMWIHLQDLKSKPLSNAKIQFNKDNSVNTDENGYAFIKEIPMGKYKLSITKNDGSKLKTKTIMFVNGTVSSVDENIIRIAKGNSETSVTIISDGKKISNIKNKIVPSNDCFKIDKNVITDYMSTCSKDIILPNKINENNIVAIGANAFKERELTSLKFSDSIVYIGAEAFKNNKLVSVIIPKNVEEIGYAAFEQNVLQEVNLVNGLISIGESAFSNNQLTSVNIPDSVTSIGDKAFMSNKLYSTKISNNIVEIGNLAFAYNNLKSINIPKSVKVIGEAAFASNQITDLVIPNNVETIGKMAFSENKISKVELPKGIKVISDEVFAYNNLKKISIPDTVTSIGYYAFAFNELEEVSVPKKVESIGDYAFSTSKRTIKHSTIEGIKYVDNPNLDKIDNNTSSSFDWKKITQGIKGESFKKGNVNASDNFNAVTIN